MKSAEQWLEPDSVNALVPTDIEDVTQGDLAKLIIKAAQAEAYAAGQQAMRETAARTAEVWRSDEPNEVNPFASNYGQGRADAAKCIRALPIHPLPESQPTQDKGE